MDEPTFIMMSMPTIIVQIPTVRLVQSQEFGNWPHNGSNTRCTHCGHPQSEEELDENDMESEEIEADDIKNEEIKEEIIFQHDIDERNHFNEYVLHNDVNLYEAHLSPVSEADIIDEIYDWEHLFADKLRGKYTDTSGIISYLKQEIKVENTE